MATLNLAPSSFWGRNFQPDTLEVSDTLPAPTGVPSDVPGYFFVSSNREYPTNQSHQLYAPTSGLHDAMQDVVGTMKQKDLVKGIAPYWDPKQEYLWSALEPTVSGVKSDLKVALARQGRLSEYANAEKKLGRYRQGVAQTGNQPVFDYLEDYLKQAIGDNPYYKQSGWYTTNPADYGSLEDLFYHRKYNTGLPYADAGWGGAPTPDENHLNYWLDQQGWNGLLEADQAKVATMLAGRAAPKKAPVPLGEEFVSVFSPDTTGKKAEGTIT